MLALILVIGASLYLTPGGDSTAPSPARSVRQTGLPGSLPFPAPPASTRFTAGGPPRGGADAIKYFVSELHWPYDVELPEEVLNAALDAQQARVDEGQFFPQKAVDPWEYVGDYGMDVQGKSERYSGRITEIQIYEGGGIRVASAKGGIWQRAGSGWVHLTDSLPILAIGSFDIDPNNSDVMIVGTGEPSASTGNGLYRTLDGGSSWIGLGNPGGGWTWKVRYEPATWESNAVHVAALRGHLRSSSGGDLGSWGDQRNVRCTALAFDPSTPGLMYGGFSSRDSIVGPGDDPKALRGKDIDDTHPAHQPRHHASSLRMRDGTDSAQTLETHGASPRGEDTLHLRRSHRSVIITIKISVFDPGHGCGVEHPGAEWVTLHHPVA